MSRKMSEESLPTLRCVHGCSEHIGDVKVYRVECSGQNIGLRPLCEGARDKRQSIGFDLTDKLTPEDVERAKSYGWLYEETEQQQS